VAAETLAPGQTATPSDDSCGDEREQVAVYDASLLLHNSNGARLGRNAHLCDRRTTAAGDTTGPTTSAVTLTPNKTNGTVDIALNASVSDVASGNANVTSAEYFRRHIRCRRHRDCDVRSFWWTDCAGQRDDFDGYFERSGVGQPYDLRTRIGREQQIGEHSVSAVLNLDKAGPTTIGLTLTPNPSNGTASVSLAAAASDSATGNTNIAAAE